MSSELTEVLETRQEAAARTARRAMVRLREGDADDLADQLAVEESLVGFGTPPVATMQTALNASISNVDWVDTAVTLPIRTAAGSFTISLAALDQGQKGISAQVLPRMVDAVNSALELSIVNGDG